MCNMSEPRRGRKIKLLHGQTVLSVSNNNKKRRRPTGENHSTNKRRNSLPYLSNVHNTEDIHQKKVSEITTMMSNFQVESTTSANSMLEEIKKMEERLSEKITSNKDKEISELEERLNNNIRNTIDASIKDTLKVMQATICTAVQNNPTIKSHSEEIQRLRSKNLRLNRKVQQLTEEHGRMKKQLTKIETKSLEHCLIIRGLPEELKETEHMMHDKLHTSLSTIMQGKTEEEKLDNAKQIVIKNCRRLGRFSRNRSRPVSVKLLHKQDVDFILDNKFDLPKGIYVDREYPIDIERKRKTLLPVLRVAKRLNSYKRQSRLDEDKVVLKGRVYNINTLNQLPDELNVFTVTSRENEHTVGFFGEINPLSNFYPSSFSHEGVNYISSEQLIQANKAKFFGDLETYNQILCCSTSLECKNLSKLIWNVDESKWKKQEISAFQVFVQSFIKTRWLWIHCCTRLETKKIVEYASDRLWGNGMPLGNPACLDSTKWISQGILGQLLECIRSEVTQPRAQSHHQLPPPSFTPFPALKQHASLSTSESTHSVGTIIPSEPMPILPSTNMAIVEELAATDMENTSASTTHVSDTTASDTDQSGPHHHATDQEAQMEETTIIN